MPPTTLDPDAVNLAKAIRQSESGGNFTAKGKSGEYGAYQYTEPTWQKDSVSAGINVPLAQATPEQQNQVAYTKIKSLKDQGYNVGQVASIWNSGKPDAYLDSSYKGVNKSGASYDVPAYAKSVATSYQTLKNGGQVNADPENPSSTANTTPVKTPETPPTQSQQPTPDYAYSHPSGSSEKGLNQLTGIINSIFPGKQVGDAIGTLGGYLGEKARDLLHGTKNAENYSLNAPTPAQVGGDIAQGALTIAAPNIGGPAGSGVLNTLGRVGTNAAIGAGLGASNAVAQGATKGTDIAKQGLIGGAIGSAASGAGELISKAAQYLPLRVARSFIPGINKETAQYAVDKGLGSPTSMLSASDSSLHELGSNLDSILNNPTYQGVKATAQDVYGNVAEQFPHAGLTTDAITEELKKLVPLHKGLIDKLNTEGLTMAELNELKSAIGNATYKSVFDEPAIKAGKQIGNAAYQGIKNFVVKTAPESSTVFDDFTKEIQLNGALQKAIRAGEKKKFWTLKDLVALMSGNAFAGPLGGIGAMVGEKVLTSPTVNMKAAGILSKAATPTASALYQGTKAPAIRGILNATSQSPKK